MPVADGILWQETPDNAAGKFVPLETVKNSALKGLVFTYYFIGRVNVP